MRPLEALCVMLAFALFVALIWHGIATHDEARGPRPHEPLPQTMNLVDPVTGEVVGTINLGPVERP